MDGEIFIQLVLATFLGGLIGIEREYKRKQAGLRTFSLICLGATLFTLLSLEVFYLFKNQSIIDFDPTRIIGQIVVGVGFLGAGLIIFRGSRIEGLTTATGIWVTAAIGVAVGIKLYLVAIFTTFLVVGILAGLRFIEDKFFNKNFEESNQ